MKRNGGFTLVEAIAAVGVLSAVFLIAGGTTAGVLRAAARERALLQMDQDANRILETLKHTICPAYIPVSQAPLNIGRTRAAALKSTAFSGNVRKWREVLAGGTDLFVFLVGLDIEGDGDIIYGDSPDYKRLILGVDTLMGDPAGYLEATDKDDTLDNLGIIDLDPIADLGLSADSHAPIDTGAARFAARFVFPATGAVRKAIYGVVRFVPFRENGKMVFLGEADPGIRADLNGNGVTTDTFVLGRLEIVYPDGRGGAVVRALSSDCVLLQDNNNSNPLFRLWQPESNSGNVVKVSLVLCNYLEQSGSWAFRDGLITRSYDSLIKAQLMVID